MLINTVVKGKQPTGTKPITANGVYDVTNFASADVQVPTTVPSYYITKRCDSGILYTGGVSPLMNFNGAQTIQPYALAYAYYGSPNGVVTGTADLSDVRSVGQHGLESTFENCKGLTGINISNIETIEDYGMQYAFRGCSRIQNNGLDLSKLTSVGGMGLNYAFYGCTNLTGNVDISNVKKLVSGNTCRYMFQDTKITGIDLRNLLEINNNGCQGMAQGCTTLTSMTLSSLMRIAYYGTDSMFSGCNLQSANLSSLLSINGNNASSLMFYNNRNLSSVDISKLANIAGNNCLSQTFGYTALTSLSFNGLLYGTSTTNTCFNNTLQGVNGCTVHFPAELQSKMSSWSNIINGMGGTNTTILFDLPNNHTLDLTMIQRGKEITLAYTFQNCPELEEVDISLLEDMNVSQMFQSGFSGCPKLTKVKFDSLKTISAVYNTYGCLQGAFQNDVLLTSLYFPAFIVNGSMVQISFRDMLTGITGCTLHFPSNLSGTNTISRLTGYPNFGGTNTTILYDLPATNILTGADTVEYERNPKYDTTTALSWRVKDTAPTATAYYTNGTTDPVVGDTIYSDAACTNTVTTISSVA